MAKLSYVDSRGRMHEVDLVAVSTIGRHPEQTLQVLDRVVSKEHAIIERQPDGRYAIRDNGSRNGTFVNGKIVPTTQILKNGDRIMVGSSEIVYHEDAKTDPLAGRVTIHADNMDTHIRSRVASKNDGRFLPEAQVDEKQLREDYEKLRISHELGSSIGLEMDLEVLLNKILDKAFEIFPADRGVILMRMPNVEHLVPMVVKSRDVATGKAEHVRISQTILNEIIQEKQGILSSDAMMDSLCWKPLDYLGADPLDHERAVVA
ncbi:MAG: FHA domain-containing protein [bacterium]